MSRGSIEQWVDYCRFNSYWSCLLTRTLETASSKDRRAHRFKLPSFFEIHLKNLQENRAAPLRPIALQRPSQWQNHQILKARTLKKTQGTVQCSLSQEALELTSVKSIIWTCVPQKVRWELLIYLVTFSLLAVTDLDTWLASSRTRAIIWSLLDLGAASDSSFG